MLAGPEPTRCFICDKHRQGRDAQGGVLYEDDLLYVGHRHALSESTAYRGWLMLEPKRHVAGLADLNGAEAAAIGKMSSRLARLLRDALGAEHVYSFVFGDHVPHLHVHLAPRYPGTPDEYRGTRLDAWPDAQRISDLDMHALVAELRGLLPDV